MSRMCIVFLGPLTDLLRKDSFVWSESAKEAFETLKEFQHETKTSGQGTGVILSQKGHPVAYFSQKFKSSNVTGFHLSSRNVRYNSICEQVNQAADALSRNTDATLLTITTQSYEVEQTLRSLNKSREPSELHVVYVFRDELLFSKGRLVIPYDSQLPHDLMTGFHATEIGGHARDARTYHHLASNFFWKQMRKDIQSFVATCQTCQQMNDVHHHPAGYHFGYEYRLSSQTNGQYEALNKCYWYYWYNTSYHTSTWMTPLKVLYGRDRPTVAHYIMGSSSNNLVEAYLVDRDEAISLLKQNFIKAQNRMKEVADRKRVFVKLKPYRQNTVRHQQHAKLGRRYFGPFRVPKRIGEVEYKLERPEVACSHPVFHVSMLRRCLGEPVQQITPLQLTDFEQLEIASPQNLAHKVLLQEGSIVINNTADMDADKDDTLEGNLVDIQPVLRRSTRVKQPSKKLTHFIV
ncbi:hypothetical protein A4A49_51935 [Nicotiana attenuata]|uniref:Uncharacterized protein n=1 Tax=Nicotiana attenuata TaxID=49451 RepID=A0A1J6JNF9_NICAT|nr:hypothetical protein A4A49_51935 [Nicotiana attenuata]